MIVAVRLLVASCLLILLLECQESYSARSGAHPHNGLGLAERLRHRNTLEEHDLAIRRVDDGFGSRRSLTREKKKLGDGGRVTLETRLRERVILEKSRWKKVNDSRAPDSRALSSMCHYVKASYLPEELKSKSLHISRSPRLDCCVYCLVHPKCAYSVHKQRCYLFSADTVLSEGVGREYSSGMRCTVLPRLNPMSVDSAYSWGERKDLNVAHVTATLEGMVSIKERQDWPDSFWWGKHDDEHAAIGRDNRGMLMLEPKALWEDLANSTTSCADFLSGSGANDLGSGAIDLQSSRREREMRHSCRPLRRDRSESPQQFWRRHFDKIYVIAMADRVSEALPRFEKWGVVPDVVEACTPPDLERIMSKQDVIISTLVPAYGTFRNYRVYSRALKLLSTSLSHIWAVERCKKEKGRACLIFEDDPLPPLECDRDDDDCPPQGRPNLEVLLPRQKAFDIIESAMRDLPPTWEVVYLGYCYERCQAVQLFGPHLGRAKAPLCLHAYAVSERAVDKILYMMKVNKYHSPVDWAWVQRPKRWRLPGSKLRAGVNLMKLAKENTLVTRKEKEGSENVGGEEGGVGKTGGDHLIWNINFSTQNENYMESQREEDEAVLFHQAMLNSLNYVHEAGMESMVREDFSPTMNIEAYVMFPPVIFQDKEGMKSTVKNDKQYRYCSVG